MCHFGAITNHHMDADRADLTHIMYNGWKRFDLNGHRLKIELKGLLFKKNAVNYNKIIISAV
jgi:hypothetical protein